MVLPALPGSLLVFAGLLVAASIDGFSRVGWTSLVFLALLVLLSYGVEIIASAAGAKRFGGRRAGAIGAVVGGVAGLFFGVPGVLLGPFLGAFVGELIARRDFAIAGKAGLGAWIGYVLGTAAQAVIVFLMIVVFAAAYLLWT